MLRDQSTVVTEHFNSSQLNLVSARIDINILEALLILDLMRGDFYTPNSSPKSSKQNADALELAQQQRYWFLSS